jgi:hypothetical protein
VIYPNPGKRSEMKFIVSPEQEGDVEIILKNLDGVTVAKKSLPGTTNVPLTFDFEDTLLPAGIYFAIITSGGNRTVKKVAVL